MQECLEAWLPLGLTAVTSTFQDAPLTLKSCSHCGFQEEQAGPSLSGWLIAQCWAASWAQQQRCTSSCAKAEQIQTACLKRQTMQQLAAHFAWQVLPGRLASCLM